MGNEGEKEKEGEGEGGMVEERREGGGEHWHSRIDLAAKP